MRVCAWERGWECESVRDKVSEEEREKEKVKLVCFILTWVFVGMKKYYVTFVCLFVCFSAAAARC